MLNVDCFAVIHLTKKCTRAISQRQNSTFIDKTKQETHKMENTILTEAMEVGTGAL